MAKITLNIRIELELIERLRNAVWHLGHGLTVTSVIEGAAMKAAEQLEQHNRGKPFPPRTTRLPTSPQSRGRPSKGRRRG